MTLKKTYSKKMMIMKTKLLDDIIKQVSFIVEFLINDSETNYYIFEHEDLTKLSKDEIAVLNKALNNELIKHTYGLNVDDSMFGIHDDAIEIYENYRPFHESGLCVANLNLNDLPDGVTLDYVIEYALEEFKSYGDNAMYEIMIEANKLKTNQ